jgi:hypothetical protein
MSVKFKGVILRTSEEVCGLINVGAGGRKSEWWSEEAAVVVREKKEAFGKWLLKKDQDSREEYKRKRGEASRAIAECKKEANKRWGVRVTSEFRESKKMFWKSVNRRRKPQEKLEIVVKDAKREQVAERWSEYFESLLNVEDDRRANLTSMGKGGVTSRNVGNNKAIKMQEVEEAVKKLKNGKAAGEDGIANEMLKKGGPAVVEWLVRLSNLCMNVGLPLWNGEVQ